MKLTLDNYHSQNADKEFMGTSQYKNFCGSKGILGCEAQAMARLNGEWEVESTPAMKESSYVDAHFSKSLHIFKAKNEDIFNKTTGALKSKFQKMDKVIARIESDKYFMKYMSGEKQVIMTAEVFGCKWKIAIDSFIKGIATVDLKVMADLKKAFWVKDIGYCSFVEYYGYDLQAAIYQKVVEKATGKLTPFFIAGASKEPEPDIEIIYIDKLAIRAAEIEIEKNIGRILKLKAGEIEADSCGVCDYCKSVKVLNKPIHFSDLIRKI